ncbi:MAG: HDOD domain-containing protein [Planctomycetota bacterium]
MIEPAENSGPIQAGSGGRGFDLVLQQMEHLSVQPAAALQVLQIASRNSTGNGQAQTSDRTISAQLVELIRTDPGLTVHTLQVAAAANLPEVDSIAQAVEVTGIQRLRPSLLALQLPPARVNLPLDPAELTLHSQAVALAAEELARLSGAVEPAKAYLAALLHDVGKLALLESFPKAYARALQAARVHRGNLLEYERQILGIDHVVFGRRLAEKWRLPQAVTHCIWLHHQPVEAIPASLHQTDLISLVSLADALARQCQIGVSGNLLPPGSLAQLTRPLGLRPADLEPLVAALDQKVRDFRAERQLDQPADARSLYRAQSEANLELARIFQDLQRRNALQTRTAELNDLISHVLEQLHHDSTLAEAMVTAAETFAQLTGGRVVIYSTGPSGSELLLACLDNGQVQWRSLQRKQDRSGLPIPTGPAPADQALGRLLEDVEQLTDWVDPAAGLHLPMTWSGRWSAGIFLDRLAGPARIDQARKLSDAITPVLGLVQDRAKARALADELAGTSANLASTQQSLAEQTTLIAVGQMAAGAAHELNTPLAVISGRAQLMQERAGSDSDRKAWSQVAQQAQAISDIISDLMEFASPPPPEFESFLPDQLLAEAINLFSHSKHPQAHAVSFDKNTGENLPEVRADRSQIRDAIVELITNAANASPAGGRISLQAEADPTGATVLLQVRDFGSGMQEETLANAYTPFFSSHQAGRRRGLGLPRAKRYVEGSGGRIWIHSRPDEGTTVFVQLPTANVKHRGSRA